MVPGRTRLQVMMTTRLGPSVVSLVRVLGAPSAVGRNIGMLRCAVIRPIGSLVSRCLWLVGWLGRAKMLMIVRPEVSVVVSEGIVNLGALVKMRWSALTTGWGLGRFRVWCTVGAG